ncbi:MAG TPA: carboxypeptidase regulatory-like domain-containing protein [Terriglobales bacterium]|nr:carboxypeptidase regulatory-like domain-containing protein [Terriglobales bacterium]
MKQRLVMLALVAVLAVLCVPPGFAQATTTVKGVCTDVQGNPIAGAVVEWYSTDSGHKYDIKTNNKGEYFSLGITPGKYKVSLMKGGQEIYHFTNVNVTMQLDVTVLDFDLKKEQAAQAAGQGITPEELKRRQEAAERAAKEASAVKVLNDKLAEARADMQPATANYDGAIAVMTEATQLDPSRDVLWATLGDAYRASAPKQTDPSEKSKRYEEALDSYQKALQTKQAALDKGEKDPKANQTLAGYYNNLADAQGKAGKVDDAVKSYAQAAQLDPAGAASYYYNTGAVLTNAGRLDDAIAAFDKSIAADPNKAEAYYQKGVNLVGKATTDPKTGKVMPVPGTAEALNKYLELQPNGQFADAAKGMLQYIGSTIETSFGKPKTKKK